ncbi:hypothetical protein FIBSPDRAFT_929585 [Athelia psychrophila]|uniref:Uncharacterized protein n=1 Tax=Athelia psychrophila TaxID=1759441 RepID=A0A166NIF1_9AGAM|nr:hypothetical protein FIBSPDRAFT_929585 [Fibularhizoctonia sp. CBS 109695]
MIAGHNKAQLHTLYTRACKNWVCRAISRQLHIAFTHDYGSVLKSAIPIRHFVRVAVGVAFRILASNKIRWKAGIDQCDSVSIFGGMKENVASNLLDSGFAARSNFKPPVYVCLKNVRPLECGTKMMLDAAGKGTDTICGTGRPDAGLGEHIGLFFDSSSSSWCNIKDFSNLGDFQELAGDRVQSDRVRWSPGTMAKKCCIWYLPLSLPRPAPPSCRIKVSLHVAASPSDHRANGSWDDVTLNSHPNGHTQEDNEANIHHMVASRVRHVLGKGRPSRRVNRAIAGRTGRGESQKSADPCLQTSLPILKFSLQYDRPPPNHQSILSHQAIEREVTLQRLLVEGMNGSKDGEDEDLANDDDLRHVPVRAGTVRYILS